LHLKANGKDIVGQPEQETVGGEDVSKQIEILDFEFLGHVGDNDANGTATSERRYKPLKFGKAIDKTSPELAMAFYEVSAERGGLQLLPHLYEG
jgi:type VI protein secretion system component Hcp